MVNYKKKNQSYGSQNIIKPLIRLQRPYNYNFRLKCMKLSKNKKNIKQITYWSRIFYFE